MKQRLYIPVANAADALYVHDELLLARIRHRDIHALGQYGVALPGLPEASILLKTDLVHGAEIGAAVGGGLGVLTGAALVLFPPAGLALPLGTILWSTLGGAAFGAWASSLVGSALPNTRLKAFQDHIQEGGILLVVDVPGGRMEEIRNLIACRFPEAGEATLEPMVPAFP